jgi:hypothetical protein
MREFERRLEETYEANSIRLTGRGLVFQLFDRGFDRLSIVSDGRKWPPREKLDRKDEITAAIKFITQLRGARRKLRFGRKPGLFQNASKLTA